MCLCVDMYVCIIWLFHASSYVLILHLCVRYDYVQRCEDTVSIEMRYMN